MATFSSRASSRCIKRKLASSAVFRNDSLRRIIGSGSRSGAPSPKACPPGGPSSWTRSGLLEGRWAGQGPRERILGRFWLGARQQRKGKKGDFGRGCGKGKGKNQPSAEGGGDAKAKERIPEKRRVMKDPEVLAEAVQCTPSLMVRWRIAWEQPNQALHVAGTCLVVCCGQGLG